MRIDSSVVAEQAIIKYQLLVSQGVNEWAAREKVVGEYMRKERLGV